jgi:hypothetical protein
MRLAVPVLLMLASLSGCASVEDLHARDEATCARNGLQPDSRDFNACVEEQQMLRRAFMSHPGR